MPRRTTSAVAALGLTAATLTAAALAATGLASAAPLPVTQLPSSGLQVSGLVVPGPLFVGVTADSTATPGVTAFTAPATPPVCSSSAAGMLVTVDWMNLSTGQRGGFTVKPCPHFNNPTKVRTEATTGSGQIAFVSWIRGSSYSPNAGQPALPGVGTFAAP
ncbi:MAG: hypothetical protein WAW85_07330 [Gordonia sp. (in: high G+C Gram-positive bacteria)]|uniref:hypothetical protein n=1 Tax=Gordonia sp. (in: high G+C Gram-positive bacteria) TaxID=84139 RepID=UPI003BB71A7B